MIEASNESMFVELQSIRACLAQVDGKIDELKYEVQASSTSQIALRQEITRIHQELSDIHATLVRHEGRLDRIERRLELTEVPTS